MCLLIVPTTSAATLVHAFPAMKETDTVVKVGTDIIFNFRWKDFGSLFYGWQRISHELCK